MAKPIEDHGHMAEATRPFKPRFYDEGKLPDPVQCAGCIIGVRNRHNNSALGLRVSDGSSWLSVVVGTQAVAPAVQHDLTPLIHEAVRAMLPGMVPQPVKVIEHAPQSLAPHNQQIADLRESIRDLASANLELSGHIEPLFAQLADLMARMEFVERNAAATVAVRRA